MFLDFNNKINITLCGMMGSGKSVVGKILSKKIDFKFIDTDKLIEQKVGKSINTIFQENGEDYFREVEEKMIIDILKEKKCVISLGGGAIVNKNIRNVLKKKSYNIYLEVKIHTLAKRLFHSKNRPLIHNKDITQTLNDLFTKRKKYYQKANLVIRNEISVNKVVEKILKKFNYYD